MMLVRVAFDHLFSSDYLVYLICLLPTIIGYLTITICYTTAFNNNRFPQWVITPWISFTGVYKPESYFFGCGLSISGLCVLLLNYVFTTRIMNDNRIINISNLTTIKYLNKIPYLHKLIEFTLKYTLILASIGIIIQSWINVDNEWLINFLSPNIQTMGWFSTWYEIIHIGSAAIFVFVNIFFYNLLVLLTFNHYQNKWLKLSFYYKLFHLILQLVCAIVLFCDIIVVCYILDPYQYQKIFHFGVNLIGFTQYVATGSYCLFIMSYGWDYYIATNIMSNKKKK